VAYDAINHARVRGIDFVMIDTAGRMHTDINLMNELSKVQRVSKPDVSIFVADALLGNEALDIAKYYSKYVRIDGLVVTKVDAYPKGGAILTFLYELKKPIYFLGVGQGYDDLRPFNKAEFFRTLIA
jgi:signal recognition particle-docking protein FtsY